MTIFLSMGNAVYVLKAIGQTPPLERYPALLCRSSHLSASLDLGLVPASQTLTPSLPSNMTE